MQKIAIFGSTGFTGLCATQFAVEKGLKVKAFVRNVNKLPEDIKNKVEIIEGNVLNYDDVLKAVKDVDGVAIILGTRVDLSPTTDLSEGTKNIIKAMKECNVNIFSVCLSAFLFYEPDKVPSRFIDLNADHQRMFDAVKASGMNYIAVLPPHIADEPGAEYTVVHDKSPGRAISKHDLGKFLIESLSQPDHYKKVCGIAKVTNA